MLAERGLAAASLSVGSDEVFAAGALAVAVPVAEESAAAVVFVATIVLFEHPGQVWLLGEQYVKGPQRTAMHWEFNAHSGLVITT